MAYADDVIKNYYYLGIRYSATSNAWYHVCVLWIKWTLKFNAKKSCLFKVGRNCKDFVNNLLLGDDVINWSANLKYLGVQFQSATYLKVDVSPCVRKFYASVNAIYHNTKYVTEIPRLCLFESFSLPILIYGCETMCLSLSDGDIKKLNVYWNNLFRSQANKYSSFVVDLI